MPVAATSNVASSPAWASVSKHASSAKFRPCRLCLSTNSQHYRRNTRQAFRCAAAQNGNSADLTPVTTGNIGPLKLVNDRETIQDVMAFTGPAPERVNGRLAMLAFVAVAFGELTTGKSVIEQVASVPFRVVFVSFLISVASILPKYSAGVSLQEITEAASKTGLPPQLKFFNKTHEVWLGRVAMLGFTGLIIVELFKGGALFKF